MARETKAQRQEREASETAQRVLMAVLNRAVKMNFDRT